MREGKYLIQAPIGSGKSFLFFDGPLYGLYKYASRKMLHTRASQGHILVWFSVHEQEYCIRRQLRPGKSRDRCQSRLFTLKQNAHTLLVHKDEEEHTLVYDRDLLARMENNKLLQEEIVFKNEGDLQSNLDTLIPPREVFAGTMMLTQDAENIFALPTNERLDVFKNIFGLLGVDEAKEVIQEAKKETQTARKIQADTSRFNERLDTYTQAIRKHYHALHTNTAVQKSVDTHLSSRHKQIQERELIQGKIRVEHADTQELPLQARENLHEIIQARYHNQQQNQERYTQEKANLQTLEKERKNIVYQIKQENDTIEQTKKSMHTLKTTSADIDRLRKEIEDKEQQLVQLDEKAVSLVASLRSDLDTSTS